MKRRITIALVLASVVTFTAVLFYPSASFRIVQRQLATPKQEALLIRERFAGHSDAKGRLTSEEEKRGWDYANATGKSYVLRKKVFIWSRLEMIVGADGTYIWKYFPAPFASEYLYVAP